MNKATKRLMDAGVEMPHAKEQEDTEMVKREKIDGDIDIVEWEGKHFAILGIHKISKDYEDKAELVEKILDKDWEIIIGIVGALLTFTKNMK